MGKISFRIRVAHTGKEMNIKLDASVTGDALLKKLLGTPGLNLPKNDSEGNPLVYKLVSKNLGKEIGRKNLEEAGIKDGDTLLLQQQLIAGV